MKLFYNLTLCLFFTITTCYNLSSQSSSPTRLYVNSAAIGSNTGLSWANAFTNLQSALGYSDKSNLTEIWVAKGTYKPTTANGDRSISFSIPSGVKVYGGFAGTETLLTNRNMALISTTNKTTLSGDLNGNDSGFSNNGENSYTVVKFRNVSNTTLLDGFTITGGNDSNGYGGGIGNYNDNGNTYTRLSSDPKISNCIITGNYTGYSGGGMCNYGRYGSCSPTIINCAFINNSSANNGGGFQNYASFSTCYPTLVNCIFTNNSSTYGGAIFNSNTNSNSTVNMYNCSFTNNSAQPGLGRCIYNEGSNSLVNLTNCIFWDNGGNETFKNVSSATTTAIYSLFESTVTGYGNSSTNLTTATSPFVSANDFTLSPCSNAINAGDTTSANLALIGNLDLARNVRIYNNGRIDLGAYEFQANPNIAISAGTVTHPSTCMGVDGSINFNSTNIPDGTYPLSFTGSGSPKNVTVTNNTFTLTGLNAGNYSNFSIQYAGCTASDTVTKTLINPTLSPSVSIAITSGTQTTCVGTSINFTATPINCSNPTYQWKKNGVNINGETGATFTSTSLISNDEINVEITNATTCVETKTATSSSIRMTVNPILTPSVSVAFVSSTQRICSGSRLTFTATPTNGGTPSYQWKKNGINISGETGATFTSSVLTSSDTISVLMTSGLQCVNSATVSSSALVPLTTRAYVDAANTVNNPDGSSWATAYKTLNDALNVCTATEIWVAKGTYKPSNSDQNAFYNIPSGVKIYGGFAGTETNLCGRNIQLISTTNKTILSGDLNDNDNGLMNLDDNIYTILKFSNASNTTVLDGFTIMGANNYNENNVLGKGGGIYNEGITGGSSNPQITNCSFLSNNANYGGGIYNNANGGTCSPTITNCSFISNGATWYGGGVYNNTNNGTCSPSLVNCSFVRNSSSYGAAVCNYGSNNSICSPTFTNCSFSINYSTYANCMYNNSLFNSTCTPSLNNCIVFGNGNSNTFLNLNSASVSTSYCLFENTIGGYSSNSNNIITNVSPFLSTTDLKLKPCSNAINAGNPLTNSSTVGTKDLVGNIRFYDSGRVDLGAYEFQANPNITLTSGTITHPNACRSIAGSVSFTTTNIPDNTYSVSFTGAGSPKNVTVANNAFSLSGLNAGNFSNFSIQYAGCTSSDTSRKTLSNVVITPSVSVAITAGAQTICTGSSVTFTATPTNGGTPSYQWKINGINVEGQTGATFTSTALVNNDAVTVEMVSNDPCAVTATALSSAITMTVNPFLTPSVSIAITSSNQRICPSTSVTFTATPTNGGTPNYQWKKNGVNISGATSATFTTSTLANNDSIMVEMTSVAQCLNTTSAISSTLTPLTTRVYVNGTVDSSGDGSSWSKAFKTLNEALNACNKTEIWVAKGTYKPSTNDRTISFNIPSGVKIYGGFAGTETNLADRNVSLISTTNKTILSGDLNGNDNGFTNNGENSYTVVKFNNAANTTLLDGFTITGGNANSDSGNGGGIFNDGKNNGVSNPQLNNCILTYNSAFSGGAMYNNGDDGISSPTLTNCSFLNNRANWYGGGMYSWARNWNYNGNSSPTLINCIFANNSSNYGGAIENYASNATCLNRLTNCTFYNNSANYGRVIYNDATWGSCSSVLTNCIIYGNGSSNTFYNSRATVSATYSLFESNVSGYNISESATNVTTSTLPFISTTDFRLSPCSIALNAGNPATTSATVGTTDLAGNARFYNSGIIDMGAYEFQANPNIAIVAGAASSPSTCFGANGNIAFTSSNVLDGTYSLSFTGTGSPKNVTVSNNAFSLTGLNVGSYNNFLLQYAGCTGSDTTAKTVSNPVLTPSVSIALTTGTQNISVGTSVTFTAIPTNGGTPTYQWKKNRVNISGETGNTFSSTSLENNDTISVVMTSNSSCVNTYTALSNSIKMLVHAKDTFTWTGITSNNWTTPTNWSPNGVPTNTDDVIIPETINMPILPSGQTVRDLRMTGSNNVIIGNNNLCVNAITGGGDSSFIVLNGTGNLIIKTLPTNTPTTIPVGASISSYDPVTIQPTNSVDFTVRVVPIATGSGFAGGGVRNFSVVVPRQWEITPSSTPGPTVLTFTNGGTTFIPTTPVVGHYTSSGVWEELPATYHDGVWTTTATSFSPFAVGEAGGFESTLPVELLSISVTNEGSVNVLDWSTANEINNKGFQIERLNAKNQWDSIGFKNANSKESRYQFRDETPLCLAGICYYRLRQVDLNGKEVLSKIVSVSIKNSDKLKVYPSPTTDYLTIENTELEMFEIYNLLGQRVLNGKITRQIDVSNLPQGTFILKVGTEQSTFMKY